MHEHEAHLQQHLQPVGDHRRCIRRSSRRSRRPAAGSACLPAARRAAASARGFPTTSPAAAGRAVRSSAVCQRGRVRIDGLLQRRTRAPAGRRQSAGAGRGAGALRSGCCFAWTWWTTRYGCVEASASPRNVSPVPASPGVTGARTGAHAGSSRSAAGTTPGSRPASTGPGRSSPPSAHSPEPVSTLRMTSASGIAPS